MNVQRVLARLLPTDPGYAPFGWTALRGLNVVPLLLCAVLGSTIVVPRLVMGPWDTLALAAGRSLMTVLQFEVVFLPLVALVVVALNGTAGRRTLVRGAAVAAALAVGGVVFAATRFPMYCVVGRWPWSEPGCDPFLVDWGRFGDFALALYWGGLVAALLWFELSRREAARALADTRLRRLEVERQETEAQLRMLQAQIEPHFLFNTLAHVQRFQQVDAGQGRAMLASLIDYMRAALPEMREPASTLRREIALVLAYVNVQRIRMGERLQAGFDVPAELLDAPMPPMMVLTLAENAVKHGLSPRREGGALSIQARAADGMLEVAVSDDGVGLRLGSGSGTGLANTRARLLAHFGPRATLRVDNNPDGPGVRAALRVPYAATAPGATR